MDKSELISNLQNLKQDRGYQYILNILQNWKNQAAEEMAVAEDINKMKDAQSDYRICSKVLVLADRLIHDLQAKSDNTLADFDPYSQ